LKYYRDLKNVVDTSFEEGKEEGREEGREAEKLAIAREMLRKGLDSALIAELTGLRTEEIERLK
ncbi:MAG: hypothetical protein AAF399_19405, partial [Bacteroidota bacterium]